MLNLKNISYNTRDSKIYNPSHYSNEQNVSLHGIVNSLGQTRVIAQENFGFSEWEVSNEGVLNFVSFKSVAHISPSFASGQSNLKYLVCSEDGQRKVGFFSLESASTYTPILLGENTKVYNAGIIAGKSQFPLAKIIKTADERYIFIQLVKGSSTGSLYIADITEVPQENSNYNIYKLTERINFSLSPINVELEAFFDKIVFHDNEIIYTITCSTFDEPASTTQLETKTLPITEWIGANSYSSAFVTQTRIGSSVADSPDHSIVHVFPSYSSLDQLWYTVLTQPKTGLDQTYTVRVFSESFGSDYYLLTTSIIDGNNTTIVGTQQLINLIPHSIVVASNGQTSTVFSFTKDAINRAIGVKYNYPTRKEICSVYKNGNTYLVTRSNYTTCITLQFKEDILFENNSTATLLPSNTNNNPVRVPTWEVDFSNIELFTDTTNKVLAKTNFGFDIYNIENDYSLLFESFIDVTTFDPSFVEGSTGPVITKARISSDGERVLLAFGPDGTNHGTLALKKVIGGWEPSGEFGSGWLSVNGAIGIIEYDSGRKVAIQRKGTKVTVGEITAELSLPQSIQQDSIESLDIYTDRLLEDNVLSSEIELKVVYDKETFSQSEKRRVFILDKKNSTLCVITADNLGVGTIEEVFANFRVASYSLSSLGISDENIIQTSDFAYDQGKGIFIATFVVKSSSSEVTNNAFIQTAIFTDGVGLTPKAIFSFEDSYAGEFVGENTELSELCKFIKIQDRYFVVSAVSNVSFAETKLFVFNFDGFVNDLTTSDFIFNSLITNKIKNSLLFLEDTTNKNIIHLYTNTDQNEILGINSTVVEQNLDTSILKVPGIVPEIVAVAGNGQIRTLWKAPINDGNAPLEGFRLRLYKNGVAEVPDIQVADPGANTYLFTLLDNNFVYSIAICAYNSEGNGETQRSSNVITQATLGEPDEIYFTATPSSPLDVVVASGESSLNVSWKEPLRIGNSPIEYYLVRLIPSSGQVSETSTESSSILINNLITNTSYSVYVAAINSYGTSSFSNPVVISTLAKTKIEKRSFEPILFSNLATTTVPASIELISVKQLDPPATPYLNGQPPFNDVGQRSFFPSNHKEVHLYFSNLKTYCVFPYNFGFVSLDISNVDVPIYNKSFYTETIAPAFSDSAGNTGRINVSEDGHFFELNSANNAIAREAIIDASAIYVAKLNSGRFYPSSFIQKRNGRYYHYGIYNPLVVFGPPPPDNLEIVDITSNPPGYGNTETLYPSNVRDNSFNPFTTEEKQGIFSLNNTALRNVKTPTKEFLYINATSNSYSGIRIIDVSNVGVAPNISDNLSSGKVSLDQLDEEVSETNKIVGVSFYGLSDSSLQGMVVLSKIQDAYISYDEVRSYKVIFFKIDTSTWEVSDVVKHTFTDRFWLDSIVTFIEQDNKTYAFIVTKSYTTSNSTLKARAFSLNNSHELLVETELSAGQVSPYDSSKNNLLVQNNFIYLFYPNLLKLEVVKLKLSVQDDIKNQKPRNVTATKVASPGNFPYVTVAWDAPTTLTNVTGYRIGIATEKDLFGTIYPNTLNIVVPLTQTSYSFYNLTNKRKYTFYAACTLSDGTDSYQVISNEVTLDETIQPPQTTIVPPSNVSVAASDGSVFVSWQNNDINTSQLKIVVKKVANNVVAKEILTGVVLDRIKVSGLENNVSYYLTITALNSGGLESTPVNSQQFIPTPQEVYGPPSAIRFLQVASADSKAVLVWTEPEFFGGDGIELSSYVIKINKEGSAFKTETIPATVSSHIISGLPYGNYTFNIYATNSLGSGPSITSNIIVIKGINTLLPAPINPVAYPAELAAKVVWNYSGTDEEKITNFAIGINRIWTENNSETHIGTGIKNIVDKSLREAVLPNLINGYTYEFYVQAIGGSVGESKKAITNKLMVFNYNGTENIVQKPSYPQNVTLIGASGFATLKWDVPSSNGGSPILYYRIKEKNSELEIITQNSSSLTYNFRGLNNGQSFRFSVAAENVAGIGEFANSNTLLMQKLYVKDNLKYKLFAEAPLNLTTNEYLYPETVVEYKPNKIIGSKLITPSDPVVITNYNYKLYLEHNGISYTIPLNLSYLIELGLDINNNFDANYHLSTESIQSVGSFTKIINFLNTWSFLTNKKLQFSLSSFGSLICEDTATTSTSTLRLYSGVNSINDFIFGETPIVLSPNKEEKVTRYVPTQEYDSGSYKCLIENRSQIETSEKLDITINNSDYYNVTFKTKHNNIKAGSIKILYKGDISSKLIRDEGLERLFSIPYIDSCGTFIESCEVGIVNYENGYVSLSLGDIKSNKIEISYIYLPPVSEPEEGIWFCTPHVNIEINAKEPVYFGLHHFNYIKTNIQEVKPADAVIKEYVLDMKFLQERPFTGKDIEDSTERPENFSIQAFTD